MVVNDSQNADVVFVVEATANLSPYVESIKNNYIIPALEHFSGGPPDERDYGYDNNYNCTLYALVAFMAVDCAPEPASVCFAPTTSSYRLLQWLDKVPFVGGAGESCSHIAEGLGTALQVFDDFSSLRESSCSKVVAKTSKHCILICNSPPYSVPTLESQSYSGLMIDQLAALMSERQIYFSIFSPRKIGFLYKIFEKAGGDLNYALSKNFAKDRRHLILLREFVLQERPVSPQPNAGASNQTQGSIEQKLTQQSPTASPSLNHQQGQKRPHSPQLPAQSVVSSSASNTLTQTTTVTINTTTSTTLIPSSVVQQATQQQQSRAISTSATSGIPSPFQPAKAPTPDLIIKQQNRGASPVPNSQISWNSPVATTGTAPIMSSVSSPAPSNMPVLTSHLISNRPMRANNPNAQMGIQQQQMGIQQSTPTLVSLVAQTPQTVKQQNTTNQVRLGMQQQIRGISQQPVPSPFSTPQAPSPSSSHQPSPLSIQRTSVPSPLMQSSVASPMQQQTQQPQPQQPQVVAIVQPQQQFQQQQTQPVTTMSQLISLAQGSTVTSNTQPLLKDQARVKIWSGIIEYQEKPGPNTAPLNPPRITYSLNCQITCSVVNGEPEINANNWPEKLSLALLPKQLIMKLFPILKSASYHVWLHFNNDGDPGFMKLSKIMSTNWVGCIQFQVVNIRMMIVLYMADKRIYMGFVPHDQEEFFKAMKEVIENHKKEQSAKQQKMMVSAGQVQVPLNQVSLAGQPHLSGQIPIQLPVQTTQISMQQQSQATPTLIQNQNTSNFFQLQQMSGGSMQQLTSSNMQPTMGSTAVTNTLGSQITQTQQTTQQQTNVLLNQALGPVTSQNQTPAFIGNNSQLSNLVASNQNTLPQIVSTGNLMQQRQGQAPGQSQQQFNLLQNQNQTVMTAQTRQHPTMNERQQNLLTIKQLERTLQEAKIKELEYQQQLQQQAEQQQQQVEQQQTQVPIRQQLQHQLQQRQQQQQVNNNPNLRLLLQQQQLRSGAPQQQILLSQQQNIGLVQSQGGQFRMQQANLSQMTGQQQQQANRPSTNWDPQMLGDF